MFCDEVPGTGVKTASKEARHDEIDERPYAECLDDGVVEHDLDSDVQEVPLCERLGADEGGA